MITKSQTQFHIRNLNVHRHLLTKALPPPPQLPSPMITCYFRPGELRSGAGSFYQDWVILWFPEDLPEFFITGDCLPAVSWPRWPMEIKDVAPRAPPPCEGSGIHNKETKFSKRISSQTFTNSPLFLSSIFCLVWKFKTDGIHVEDFLLEILHRISVSLWHLMVLQSKPQF